jgi:peptide/nickel transport system substrate-binding protein
MAINRRQFTAGAIGAGAAASLNLSQVSADLHTSGVRYQQTADGASQIIVGLTQEPTKFNPLGTRIEVDEAVHYQLFDMLWYADENGAYQPSLATEVPTIENGGLTEDGLTWTINVRDDVTWHDGEPFTAEDVKFAWEFVMREDFIPRTRQGFNKVESVEVVSPTQVTLTMKEPFAPFMAIWATSPLVPKHVLENAENPNEGEFYNHPIGTGAFKWSERIAGDRISLVANTEYFGDGPHVDFLVFKYVPDTTSFFTQFKTGEIDHTALQGITAENHEEAIGLADRQIYDGPSASVEFINMNLSFPQFQDIAVRQALYYAMDKQTIIDNVYYGLPSPTESYLYGQSWAFNPDLPVHEYNPDRANQILDEAGWARGGDGVREKDGVRLAFTNSTTAGNNVREQTQAYLQQTWSEIGVEMEINNMPAAVIWGDFYNNSEFDTVMIGNTYGVGADPDPTLAFHSTSPSNASGTNSIQLKDADLDALIEEGVVTMDMEARLEIYYNIQKLLRENLYMLPIFQYANTEGSKAGLTGYVRNPNYRTNTWNIKTWKWES